MRRLLIAVFGSLLAVALIAPAAQGATQVRLVQTDLPPVFGFIPPTPGGMLTLDFVFKNKPGNTKKFTPRRLTRIDFSKVPLLCYNAPVNPNGTSQLLLTTTLETKIKLRKTAPPNPAKAKPGRYAFNFTSAFTGNFPAFTGTISGWIDKPTTAPRPRIPRSGGSWRIDDLDSPPGQWNCSTAGGTLGWGGPLPAP
jgi:hypothetical protein